jgi:hypothetical protein
MTNCSLAGSASAALSYWRRPVPLRRSLHRRLRRRTGQRPPDSHDLNALDASPHTLRLPRAPGPGCRRPNSLRRRACVRWRNRKSKRRPQGTPRWIGMASCVSISGQKGSVPPDGGPRYSNPLPRPRYFCQVRFLWRLARSFLRRLCLLILLLRRFFSDPIIFVQLRTINIPLYSTGIQ